MAALNCVYFRYKHDEIGLSSTLFMSVCMSVCLTVLSYSNKNEILVIYPVIYAFQVYHYNWLVATCVTMMTRQSWPSTQDRWES